MFDPSALAYLSEEARRDHLAHLQLYRQAPPAGVADAPAARQTSPMSAAKYRILPPLPPPPPQIELTLTLSETEARLMFDALTPGLYFDSGSRSTPQQQAVVQAVRNALDDAVIELRAQTKAVGR